MKLNLIYQNGKEYISGIELKKELGASPKSKFASWIKRQIERAYLKENIDFVQIIEQSSGGRKATNYLLTIESAKRISIISGTKKSKELIDYLLELEKQKDNLDLLTHDQVVMLSVLEGFFKYVENQKLIQKKHTDTFVKNYSGRKNSYAEFHIYRNEILQIEPERLNEQIQNYCIENQKRMPNLKSKHSKINFLNAYDNLRNAVWDFLEIKGEINSLKLANLVKRMAEAKNLQMFTRNETNLFQQKENINLKAIE